MVFSSGCRWMLADFSTAYHLWWFGSYLPFLSCATPRFYSCVCGLIFAYVAILHRQSNIIGICMAASKHLFWLFYVAGSHGKIILKWRANPSGNEMKNIHIYMELWYDGIVWIYRKVGYHCELLSILVWHFVPHSKYNSYWNIRVNCLM